MILKIREYRHDMHMTQKELADRIGNVQRNVSNWENGISEPDCQCIMKICDVLEITVDELFGRERVETPRQNLAGIELSILKSVRTLAPTKQFALMQFLRELES
ncbi:MAG: helix-turn-helix transcriptional regulator [Clostridiales bacterium]|nr:helix-turn-helix transcriptional regulator [Clostridiales bacterium]